MNDEYQWFAGIDWASEEHAACVMDGDGKVLEERAFAHSGEGLADLVAWLIDKTGAQPVEIAVGIEAPHGAVVETLLGAGLGVFSVNPKQSDRFRDRSSLAGAKDDRFDAKVIASAVRTDRQHLRHLRPVPDVIVELREWSRIHHELRAQRSGLISRFNAQLLRDYPAFRMLCKGALGAAYTLDSWNLAPNPKTAKKDHWKAFCSQSQEKSNTEDDRLRGSKKIDRQATQCIACDNRGSSGAHSTPHRTAQAFELSAKKRRARNVDVPRKTVRSRIYRFT